MVIITMIVVVVVVETYPFAVKLSGFVASIMTFPFKLLGPANFNAFSVPVHRVARIIKSYKEPRTGVYIYISKDKRRMRLLLGRRR